MKETNAKSTISYPPEQRYYMVIADTPLSIETFYKGRYSSHITDELYGYPPKKPQGWITTSEMIAQAEQRLDIVFPTLLRKLYEFQNGGSVGEIFVPTQPNPGTELDNWRGVFAYGYYDLWPLEGVQTLFDCALSFMSEEEAESGIGQCPFLPIEAKRYIVLAQRYHDTTFLDYSKSRTNPRVGVFDFEGFDKEILWFDSFSIFFSALRRGTVESE